MSSDLVHAQREIDNLINLLADARAENMKLRAALKDCWTVAAEHHDENLSRSEWSGSSTAQRKAKAIVARSGLLLNNIKTIVRAALEGKHD